MFQNDVFAEDIVDVPITQLDNSCQLQVRNMIIRTLIRKLKL